MRWTCNLAVLLLRQTETDFLWMRLRQLKNGDPLDKGLRLAREWGLPKDVQKGV